ncbi:MAG: DnaJ domain-containing protein [Prevotellaceae bacterium]|jgi:DnaJ like chaperone protein|nr:DnaJ domain-containing protein [Prevotellaceae bacterium]
MGRRNKNEEKSDSGCGRIVLLIVFFILVFGVTLFSGKPAFIVLFLLFAIPAFSILANLGKEEKKTIPATDNALMGIISVVMKADGKATKSELNEVKPFLLKKFGEKKAKKMLLLLKEKLQRDIHNIRPHCLSLNRTLTYAQKLEFLILLFRIAETNGEICENEADILSRIARHIAIRDSHFMELTHKFSTFYNYQKKQTAIVYYDTEKAYRILQIEKNASMEEIKKSYRKLAMLHHPDRVAHHDTAAQKQAAEKFHRINEAYRHLKKRKQL